jgi:cellulose synthase/poly-beta-1,6-N-acetylglucosamine synthase-like glycosyltransferase
MFSLQTILVVVFWACAATVLFAYVGYPLVLWLLARWLGQPFKAPAWEDNDLPSLSLLIAAHNEASVIEERVLNALQMAYPPDRLEIAVASDGSEDGTTETVRRYAERGVRLLDYKPRRGKAATLNTAIAELKGEIILLSDANTYTDSTAARKIVRGFKDPKVGVVCGRLVLTDPATGSNADSLYWKYETFLKRCESRLGALLGSNGAIYAIRRELFLPIPNDTIVDDIVIPLQAKLRTGCAIVYDYEAVAYEETAPDIHAEFQRRSRIGAGGFQSILLLWRLLNPRRGWVALTFLGHKILRWLCPFFMVGAFFSNLLLLEEPLYRWMIFAQLGFYMTSLAAAFVPGRYRSLKPLRLTTMFTSMNLALLVGFWRFASGNQRGLWRPTARLAEANAASWAAHGSAIEHHEEDVI